MNYSKKIAAFVCAAALVSSAAGYLPQDIAVQSGAVTASAATKSAFECQVSDTDELTLTKYTGADTEVEIPASINGLPVTVLTGTFSGCTDISKITIPKSVKAISTDTFDGIVKFTIYCYKDSAAEKFAKDNKLDYELIDELPVSGNIGANITWAIDSMGTLIIKGSGEMVTSCITTPWINRTDINKVVIEDGVTTIGDDAFSGCTSITSVTMADSITDIGDSAFLGCTGLESIDMSANMEYIDDDAFHGCTNLKSIDLTDSIKKIGDSAFMNCSSLTSVILPPELIYIDEQLFEGCTNLKSVNIPNGVKHISFSAFENCSSLTEITLPAGVRKIDEMTFYNCSSLKSIVIPEGVERISSQCFYNCTQLESIIIPDSVTSIFNYAFSGCDKVKIYCHEGTPAEQYAKRNDIAYELIADSGSVGDNITWVLNTEGTLTISGSGEMKTSSKTSPWIRRTDIKKVVVTDGVTSIGNDAFYECTRIKSVTIADSVTDIGDFAFMGCAALESVDMPSKLEYLCDDVFHNCISLTSIELPATLEHIGECVFMGCSSLKSADIPDGIRVIDEQLFEGCDHLESVTLPDSVTVIHFNAFKNCSSLTEIKLPANLKTIDSSAFSNCWRVKSIVIPDSVHKIPASCFEYCTCLHSVTIPDSVTDIYKNSFSGCVDLTIYCHAGSAAEFYAKKYAIPYELLPAYHDHILTAVEAKEATASAAGNIAYWYCPTCDKYFSDKDGKNEITKADTVIPALGASLYPQVKTAVKDHKIGFRWTKVPGAEKYGIAVYQANKWKVVKQLDGSITTWTSPRVANGTYRLVVLAKVNGQWVNAGLYKRAFYVTVK